MRGGVLGTALTTPGRGVWRWLVVAVVAATLLAVPAPAQAATLNLTVNSTADVLDADVGDGVCDIDLSTGGEQCTLRAAVQEIWGDTGTIGFDPSLSGATIDLSIQDANGRDDNADFGSPEQGDLDLYVGTVDGSISVIGPPGGITIDGTGDFEAVFHVEPGGFPGTISLSDLNLIGGGISNDSNAVVDNDNQELNLLSLTRVTTTGLGSGVLSIADTLIVDSTIRNQSTLGVGIFHAAGEPISDLTMRGTTVTGNRGAFGVGLYPGTSFDISNSTISGNWDTGLFTQGDGVLDSVTIAGNNVQGGSFDAAVEIIGYTDSGFFIAPDVEVVNSVIADDNQRGCLGTSQDASAVLPTSLGHNVDEDGTCGLNQPTDLQVDPGLGALQDNGGPTHTHAIDTSSPAFNSGDTSLAVDQRGTARPIGSADDRGAYEHVVPPTLTIDDVTAAEGDSGTTDFTFTVTVDPPAGTGFRFQTVQDTASEGVDYVVWSGTTSVSAGSPSTTISVPVRGDTIAEADETFTLEISEVTNPSVVLGDGGGLGTIIDDDAPPQISVADVVVGEGDGDAEFVISLDKPAGQTVSFGLVTTPISATADEDYTATGGVGTIATGFSQTTIPIAVADDALDEDEETFRLAITNVQNADVADDRGIATIVDDDDPPTISVGDVAGAEGDGDQVLTVALDAASGKEVTAALSTTPATATADVDFTPVVDQPITFTPGQTSQTVTVPILDDALDEDDETWTAALSDVVNAVPAGTATGTILDDDPAPGLSIDDVTTPERGTAVFTVTLDAPSALTATVDFATRSGTATEGADLPGEAGVLVFPPGTTVREVEVTVTADDAVEGDEAYDVVLADPVNAVLVDAVGTGTIIDDDPRAVLLDVMPSPLLETDGPAAADLALRLTEPAPTELTVEVATGPGGTATPGEDFTALGSVIRTFPEGATTPVEGPVALEVLGDTAFEGDEVIEVLLTPSTAFPAAGVEVTITDDDPEPPSSPGGAGGGTTAPGDGDGEDDPEDPAQAPAGAQGHPVSPDTPGATFPTDVGDVRIDLRAIDGEGTLTVAPRSDDPGTRDGFRLLGMGFDLSITDGVSFEVAVVCLPFDPEALPDGVRPADLRLQHFDDGVQRDITTRVDLVDHVVCGETDHFSPFALGYEQVPRLAGVDRVATAAAVSADAFVPGVPVAYLATAGAFPDALAAGAAAAHLGGPVLLVGDVLPEATAVELRRLAPAAVVVVGGEDAVPEAVLDAVAEVTGTTPIRHAGPDRHATAAAVSAATFDPGVAQVVVATGESFADALSGGPLAAAGGGPVLLVQQGSVPPEVEAELRRLAPASVAVVGGPAAVGDAVLDQLEAIVDGPVTRLSGPTRYDSAVAVSQAFVAGAGTVHVASGEDFPDALAGVPPAVAVGGPVLLVRPDGVPAAVAAELARIAPTRIVVLGGPAAVDEPTRLALVDLLAG